LISVNVETSLSQSLTEPEAATLLRLRIAAEADPCVLGRVLARFHNLNVLPRRVVAELSCREVLHIQLDLADVAPERLSQITARLGQLPSILQAYWHYV